MFLELGSPELDTALQMGPHQGRVEGEGKRHKRHYMKVYSKLGHISTSLKTENQKQIQKDFIHYSKHTKETD